MRNPRVLYLLLDGGRARFVERREGGHFAAFEEHQSDTIHDKSHEIGRDKPSRVQESASKMRSAAERRSDPHDKGEAAFVDEMLGRLGDVMTQGKYELLVLAAPSTLHAAIRKTLPAPVAAKMKTLIGKDLTRIPDVDLKDHLSVPLA
jgi:protein required for attachment to host cells